MSHSNAEEKPDRGQVRGHNWRYKTYSVSPRICPGPDPPGLDLKQSLLVNDNTSAIDSVIP